jgi:hypothetical protein
VGFSAHLSVDVFINIVARDRNAVLSIELLKSTNQLMRKKNRSKWRSRCRKLLSPSLGDVRRLCAYRSCLNGRGTAPLSPDTIDPARFFALAAHSIRLLS